MENDEWDNWEAPAQIAPSLIDQQEKLDINVDTIYYNDNIVATTIPWSWRVKRRGRPPKPENLKRDAVLRVRMTKEAYGRFAKIAGERSMSAIVRDLIDRYVHEQERKSSEDSWKAW
jgi:hypothetical protein